MPKQRGTFSYPGGKTLIRQWIIDYISKHHLYVEPFGGAASVLVGKPRSKVEVYNDINSDCVTFFEALKYRGDELSEWVDNTPYSRELFEKWVNEYPDWPNDLVEHAGRFLFIQHAAFGGKGLDSGSPTFRVNKVDDQPDACNSKVWDRKPDDVEWLKERFKGVQLENMDYTGIIEKYDHERAFFYFDPPYVDVGDAYYQTADGGFDHTKFTTLIQDMDADWIVSYSKKIPDGLQSADYNTVSRTKEAIMSKQRPEKTETLIMNYDPKTQPLFSEYDQRTLPSGDFTD